MKNSTGDSRSAVDCSVDNRSTGNFSTGTRSTGRFSTGDNSTGNWSTGRFSTGDNSTGNWSTGRFSTGDWSISNYSTGHFSTEDYSGFGCFDKPCTLKEWTNFDLPSWLYFDLTEWVEEKDMTDEEKKENPSYKATGGFLRVYDYRKAFQMSYNNATREEQLKIKELPNFDADKFYKISGIKIDDAPAQELTIEEIEKKLGYNVKLVA